MESSDPNSFVCAALVTCQLLATRVRYGPFRIPWDRLQQRLRQRHAISNRRELARELAHFPDAIATAVEAQPTEWSTEITDMVPDENPKVLQQLREEERNDALPKSLQEMIFMHNVHRYQRHGSKTYEPLESESDTETGAEDDKVDVGVQTDPIGVLLPLELLPKTLPDTPHSIEKKQRKRPGGDLETPDKKRCTVGSMACVDEHQTTKKTCPEEEHPSPKCVGTCGKKHALASKAAVSSSLASHHKLLDAICAREGWKRQEIVKSPSGPKRLEYQPEKAAKAKELLKAEKTKLKARA